MVTHISSPATRTRTSLPLSPPLSTVSSSRHGPSSSASAISLNEDESRPRRTLRGGTSNSSQATLIARPHDRPISPPASSVGGYTSSSASTQAHHSTLSVSSYASTPATTRSYSGHRHRHHHSRARSRSGSRGPVEVEAPDSRNSFPWFGQSGDVEIVIRDRRRGVEKRYLLHNVILAQNSSWFDADLKNQLPRQHGQRATGSTNMPGATTMSRLEDATAAASQSSPETRQAESARQRRYEPDWVSSAAATTSASQSARKWYYELDWSSLADDDESMPLLKQVNPTSVDTQERLPRPPAPSPRTKPSAPPTSFFRTLASSISGRRSSDPSPPPANAVRSSISSEESDLFAAYDNLFLCFYNHTPTFSTTNIATAYLECKLLLSLAHSYSAQRVVGPRVDHHLLGFGSHLWRQVAKYPPSYLKLGHLARSRAIFSEALTHVVGQWPAGESALKKPSAGINGPILLDLVEDKVEELEELKFRTEAKLFRLNLTTSRGDRVSPSSSYIDWLAVSLWRQWVADMTTPAVTSILKPSNSSTEAHGNSKNREKAHAKDKQETHFYQLLADPSNDAYLTHESVKQFLKHARLTGSGSGSGRGAEKAESREVAKRFERRLDELKNLAREVARPLTRNVLQLDLDLNSDLDTGRERDRDRDRDRARTHTRTRDRAHVQDRHDTSLPYLICVKCDERDFVYVWDDE